MRDDLVRADHAPLMKLVINWLAAALGVGTFLGVVNLLVGVLSATWLAVQLYGYLSHELPMKRMRKKILERELERLYTKPTESVEADE